MSVKHLKYGDWYLNVRGEAINVEHIERPGEWLKDLPANHVSHTFPYLINHRYWVNEIGAAEYAHDTIMKIITDPMEIRLLNMEERVERLERHIDRLAEVVSDIQD